MGPGSVSSHYWANVTDDDLLNMIQGQRGGGDKRVKDIAAELQRNSGAQEGERPILEILVQTAVGQEFVRRMQERQTPDGKLLLEFVVQSSSESLRRLMPALTSGLYWHPLLHTFTDAKEEIAAEAGIALADRLVDIRNVQRPFERTHGRHARRQNERDSR